MEEKAIEKSNTSTVDDTQPVNPIKGESEIEEGLREKQVEAQKEPNPADSDFSGTTLEEQTGKNMEGRRKALYLDDEMAYERSSRKDEQ